MTSARTITIQRDGRLVAGAVAIAACLAAGIAPSFAAAPPPPSADAASTAGPDVPMSSRIEAIGPLVDPAANHALAAPAAAALAPARSELATDTKYPARSHPEVDTLHHALDLDARGDRIKATDVVTFRATTATSSVTLDLAEPLEITAATLDGSPVAVTRAHDTATFATGPLAADSQHALRITYGGTPRAMAGPARGDGGPSEVGWLTGDGGSVVTVAQPYGTSAWLPCNEAVGDRAFVDLRLTTSADRVAVSGGTLTGRTRDASATVTTYHLDHAVPASALAIGIDDFRWTPINIGPRATLNFYVRGSSSARDLQDWTTDVQQTMSWYDNVFRMVPFASMGVFETARREAAPGAGMVGVNRAGLGTQAGGELARQMAGQWFGAAIAPRDQRDAWLTAGFAGFAHDAFLTEMRAGTTPTTYADECRAASARSGPASDYDPSVYGGPNVERCGAGLFATLNQQHGWRPFWLMMRAWLKEAAYTNTARADVEAFLDKQFGKPHAELLRTWLDAR